MMTPYILRVDLGREVKYGTIERENLVVEYKPIYKRLPKEPLLSKRVGVDRSSVYTHFRSTDRPVINARGSKGLYPGNDHFRLLDRHKHIRVLAEEDQAALAEYDRRIAEKVAELRAIQQERAETVAKAWRRAGKVDISELEEKAQS